MRNFLFMRSFKQIWEQLENLMDCLPPPSPCLVMQLPLLAIGFPLSWQYLLKLLISLPSNFMALSQLPQTGNAFNGQANCEQPWLAMRGREKETQIAMAKTKCGCNLSQSQSQSQSNCINVSITVCHTDRLRCLPPHPLSLSLLHA